MRISLKDVKRKSAEGRFFKYDSFNDKLFVPVAVVFMWLFANMGFSGNTVTWISGYFSILGGILLASDNGILIFLGSFSYVMFYLLDYTDGGVARLRKESGIEGQYVDWIMHLISTTAISTGIFIGAFRSIGDFWIVPFGVLFVVASALLHGHVAFGWWSVCMYHQQNKVNKNVVHYDRSCPEDGGKSKFFKCVKYTSLLLFHGNYAIYVLPLLSLINVIFRKQGLKLVDFRCVLTVLGGTLFFLHTVHETMKISKFRKLQRAYAKLFVSNETPDLPKEHFFFH